MKIHCAAILALGISADAFSTTQPHQRTSTQLFASTFEDDGFTDALKGKSNEEGSEDPDEPASGSSRFKEIMQAAKSGGSGRQVPNPYLSPTAPAAPAAPAAATGGVNLDNMSVEDQAALLRQLMAGAGGAVHDPNTPPPAMKEKRTDQAGKPTGRNRDADSIANSADLYFAQLKRDSTVRTLARIRGEDEVAQAIMEDEGIKELDNLLVENPYLKGQKQEESTFFEAIPEESLGPFIMGNSEPEGPVNTSGPKYKEILKQKRSKATAQPAAVAAPVAEPPAPETAASPPVVQAAAATPAPVTTQAEEPVEIPPPAQPTVTSYTDEARQKLRTFMGLLLKHRGGPGFGSGRLKGPEIDHFETMLGEIMTMLREETMEAAPANVPMMTAPAPAAAAPAPVSPVAATPAVSANADLAQVDGAVACIEGATMMYKNSPAQLRESMLGALRAALLGAVNTCSRASGVAEVTAEEIGGSAAGSIAQIDGVIACIDGAVTMYKNSPDTVKPDMLVALRAALVSAIGMCNSVMEGGAVAAPPASVSPVTPTIETSPPQTQTDAVVSSTATTSVPSPPEAEPAAPASPEEPEVDESLVAHMGPDGNSEVLTKIYNQVKAASGNGSLGLRSDLTSSEASDLADSLVEARKVLMKELNEGIPEVAEEELQEEPQPVVAKAEPVEKSSVASRYKEMLAKARAEKEGKAVAN